MKIFYNNYLLFHGKQLNFWLPLVFYVASTSRVVIIYVAFECLCEVRKRWNLHNSFVFSICWHFERVLNVTWNLRLICDMQNKKNCLCSQVSDLSSKLREMRQYWVQLPVAICSKLAAGGSGQDKCWNGITKARWGREPAPGKQAVSGQSQAYLGLNVTLSTSQIQPTCSPD